MVEAHGAGPDAPRREFGPYTIVRRLGVGGMAETFEAIRHGSEGFTQRVCLKLALPFLRDDEAFVRMFQREARLAAKLRHGNIVGVLDYGNVDGTPYMALELVDGVDLQGLLERERQLTGAHVSLLAIELAKGLSHAHDPPFGVDDSGANLEGVVHRDLSPSNVMLSQQGEVMLTDFGVAKAMSGASHHQSAVKGKVPYMSPEQLRNESLDGRSDLFSLGVLLYECLSGSRPYDAGNDPATIMRILKGERVSLHELARQAPRELCEVIDRLIEPDRDRRPGTALELIEQLDSFAPPPRSQRELGAMVTELRRESLLAFRDVEVNQDTDLQPGAAVQSGVVPSQVVPNAPARPASDPEPNKSAGLQVNASAMLSVTIVTAILVGILLFAMRLM